MKENKNTKSLLLKESINQFAKDGFAKTSIRSICSKLDISIASINYHFKNKKCLIKATVDFAISEFEEVISQSENLAKDNFQQFLIQYAIKTRALDKAVLLIFRDIFQSEAENIELDKEILRIKSFFYQVAYKIAKADKNFKMPEDSSFNLQLNIFISLIILEVINKALLPSHVNEENFEEWVRLNLKIIFNFN